MNERIYLVIDLKSFYASVECAARGLDCMTTNLVVADPDRTDKTICLAVSPSMKALGVRNRCRVFEIPKNISYIMAEPRMQLYIDCSADIYAVYMKYVSKDDIWVYSIDEAFLDVTQYLPLYHMTARELGQTIMTDILKTTGIRASCGIGTNMYLAKVALDITAKHAADFIGFLDEKTYRETLWDHRPITDFWRIGAGIAKRLSDVGMITMGDVAAAAGDPEKEPAAGSAGETGRDLLYRMFGIDAELLIDHAWGRETARIADIKAYRPKANSLSNMQVLAGDYPFEKGKIIVKEMVSALCLDMLDKGVVTGSLSLWIGYSNQLRSDHPADGFSHENRYLPGQWFADPAKGTAALPQETNSDRILVPAAAALYDRIVDRRLPVHRILVCANNIHAEADTYRQLSLFDLLREQSSTPDSSGRNAPEGGAAAETPESLEKNRRAQEAMLAIQKKFGKNAVLKGLDLEDGATAKERNAQIGGHKSGTDADGSILPARSEYREGKRT